MKTSAELAAARRPAAGHPTWERLRRYPATNLVIPSFIATLGSMFLLRGIIRFVSINPATNQPDSIAFFPGDFFKSLLTGHIAGPIYAQLLWLILVAVIGYLILNRHTLGNQI